MFIHENDEKNLVVNDNFPVGANNTDKVIVKPT